MERRALEIALGNSTLEFRQMMAIEITDKIRCAELKTFPVFQHVIAPLGFRSAYFRASWFCSRGAGTFGVEPGTCR